MNWILDKCEKTEVSVSSQRPLEGDSPRGRSPFWRERTPERTWYQTGSNIIHHTAAVGTHPTGMHSCLIKFFPFPPRKTYENVILVCLGDVPHFVGSAMLCH